MEPHFGRVLYRRMGRALGGIVPVIFGLLFLYLEVGGIVYTCIRERTGLCILAIALPPFAWYKAYYHTFEYQSAEDVISRPDTKAAIEKQLSEQCASDARFRAYASNVQAFCRCYISHLVSRLTGEEMEFQRVNSRPSANFLAEAQLAATRCRTAQ